MTTYTFNPSATTTSYNWSDPLTWAGGVVPNGADADVVLPTVTTTSTGQPYVSTVSINNGQNYEVRSATIANNELYVGGGLTIDGSLTLLTGGIFYSSGAFPSFGSLSNSGTIIGGNLGSSNAITNAGLIHGADVSFAGFTNMGLLEAVTIETAKGGFTNIGTMAGGTVTAPNGGFTNFADGTLTGGTYDSMIFMNVGGFVTTLAATVNQTPNSYAGIIASVDPATGVYHVLEDTLRTVAPTGTLAVSFYVTDTLTVEGALNIGSFPGTPGTFDANRLSVAGDGAVSGEGTINAPVTNNGVVTNDTPATLKNYVGSASPSLVINGGVSGTGAIRVGRAVADAQSSQTILLPATIELQGAVSNTVVFDDSTGTLKLDQPSNFTGAILPSLDGSTTGQTIDLGGVALSSIQSTSYTGDRHGGTLTLDEGTSALHLRFIGSFDQSSFRLSAGPQPLSSSPPSVILTVEGHLAPATDAFYVDGSHGVQHLQGSADPSFVNTAFADGSGTVLVDLRDGYVQRGTQTDATLGNIAGVQLGNQTSVVLGLTSGTDLIYGGAGVASFYNEGATDYIQGGTGTNNIVSGSGTTIFYGNGGTDVMLGGQGNTFMQAGQTADSLDVFYGNGGTDYVYGGAGTTNLIGGSGTEDLTAGSGSNVLVGSTTSAGFAVLNGGSGTDAFYGGIGVNLMYEGSHLDAFQSQGGTDYIYGGSGTSYIQGGAGVDVITTGSGDQNVTAGSGHTYFNDTAANLHAGRFDKLDNFSGGQGTDLYLPTAVQGATNFIGQNGGTAIMTSVGGGSAEVFISGASVASVQDHTHFTL